MIDFYLAMDLLYQDEIITKVQKLGKSIVDEKRYNFRDRLILSSGLEMSVQTLAGSYCEPRIGNMRTKYYKSVEIGYPSEEVEDLMNYAEDKENPTDTVYGFVPIEILEKIYYENGGLNIKRLTITQMKKLKLWKTQDDYQKKK